MSSACRTRNSNRSDVFSAALANGRDDEVAENDKPEQVESITTRTERKTKQEMTDIIIRLLTPPYLQPAASDKIPGSNVRGNNRKNKGL
jgi:hypothetical protein